MLAVCLAILAAGAVARPPSMRLKAEFRKPIPEYRAPLPTGQGVYSVVDYGAKGDASTDNTGPFMAALQAANATHGGIVWVPPGQYLFKGELYIPRSVQVMGSNLGGHAHNAGQGKSGVQPTSGSVFLVTASRGNVNGTAFITMDDNTAVQGVTIFYPDNKEDEPPVAYPPSISMVGFDCTVTDTELLNSWIGIYGLHAGRHIIARVTGQPVHRGIMLDEIYDVGRLENIHWNPWYSNKPIYVQHQLTEGVGFQIARSDWEYTNGLFVFGMAVGYRFVESSTGSCNGEFVGSGADMCPNASVLVEAADPWGLLFVNGEFTSFISPSWGNSSGDKTQIVVGPNNKGAVRLDNSAFWGPSEHNAIVQGSGSVSFSGCVFNAWQGNSSIYAATGSVSVTGSVFQKAGVQMELAAGVQRAIFTSNLLEGPVNISKGTSGDVQVGLNAATATLQ